MVGLSREDKLAALHDGAIDAVQVYDVMETLRMEAELGEPAAVLPLEGLPAPHAGPVRLGYAQVCFGESRARAGVRRPLAQSGRTPRAHSSRSIAPLTPPPHPPAAAAVARTQLGATRCARAKTAPCCTVSSRRPSKGGATPCATRAVRR